MGHKIIRVLKISPSQPETSLQPLHFMITMVFQFNQQMQFPRRGTRWLGLEAPPWLDLTDLADCSNNETTPPRPAEMDGAAPFYPNSSLLCSLAICIKRPLVSKFHFIELKKSLSNLHWTLTVTARDRLISSLSFFRQLPAGRGGSYHTRAM